MKAVHLLSDASRHAGGLHSAVSSLCGSLAERGWNIEVIASSRNFSKEDQAAWTGTQLRLFPSIGPAAFSYLPRAGSQLATCAADVVHAHGLWTYVSQLSSQARRLGIRTVLSPHGMLDPWAISNSRWKKRFAMQLFERRNIHSSDCIHALCESEASSVRSLGFKGDIAIIPNGVFLPEVHPSISAERTEPSKTIVFLGRLHPKKGLVELLQAWALFSRGSPCLSENWRLQIIGWGNEEYQASLTRMASELGVENSIDFSGPLFGRDKEHALATAHAFILPSFSEGLPMAILEAWSYSLPTIMTDHCNLPSGFISGAALRCEPNAESILSALQQLATMDDSAMEAMGKNGRKLVETQFTWDRVAASMVQTYSWLCGKSDKPSCVESAPS